MGNGIHFDSDVAVDSRLSANDDSSDCARHTVDGCLQGVASTIREGPPEVHDARFRYFHDLGIGLAYYIGMSIISTSLLQDTILSISLAIAFYYGLTGFACVWYFRKESFSSIRAFFFKFMLPLIGGSMLAFAFVASAIQMLSPDYSGTSYFGVGGVFVIGIGSLAVGVVIMFLWQFKQPGFFRGETLRKDTPVLVPD